VRFSASIDVAMLLAAQEAIAGGFKGIEPEHLLEAILKLSEIPVEELEKMTNNQGAAKELVKEAASVRSELKLRTIESTRVRRELRALLGKGQHEWDGGRVPRSEATRRLFEVAGKAAEEGRTGVFSATHLLDALLRTLQDHKSIKTVKKALSSISITCHGSVATDLGSRVMLSLASESIFVDQLLFTPMSITVCVPPEQRDRAIQTLHKLMG